MSWHGKRHVIVTPARLAPILFVSLFAFCGNGDGDPDLLTCTMSTSMAEIEQKLLVKPMGKCWPCHRQPTLFPTTFDLYKSGLAARVVDQTGALPKGLDQGKCADKPLLPKATPLAGLFVEKVEQAMPSCGGPMPPPGLARLTADEISCIKRWAMLAAIAGSP